MAGDLANTVFSCLHNHGLYGGLCSLDAAVTVVAQTQRERGLHECIPDRRKRPLGALWSH